MRYIRLFLMITTLQGCTYDFLMVDRTEKKVKYVELANNFYLWGWAGKGQVDLYKACGTTHIYKVHDRQSIGQLLVSLVTLGLVQPRTVAVTCSAKSGSEHASVAIDGI